MLTGGLTYIVCISSVQFVYGHSCLWDIYVDTYSTALKTTENYFPSLRVFAGKAKFWASSCRQNDPSQLAPMHWSVFAGFFFFFGKVNDFLYFHFLNNFLSFNLSWVDTFIAP